MYVARITPYTSSHMQHTYKRTSVAESGGGGRANPAADFMYRHRIVILRLGREEAPFRLAARRLSCIVFRPFC